jgi:hypothetical protein
MKLAWSTLNFFQKLRHRWQAGRLRKHYPQCMSICALANEGVLMAPLPLLARMALLAAMASKMLMEKLMAPMTRILAASIKRLFQE